MRPSSHRSAYPLVTSTVAGLECGLRPELGARGGNQPALMTAITFSGEKGCSVYIFRCTSTANMAGRMGFDPVASTVTG